MSKTIRLGIALFLLFSATSFAQKTFKFSDKSFPSGAVMTRRNISFTDDCHRVLKPNKTLDSLYNFLKTHPNVKMEIGSYAGKPCATCKGCSQTEDGAKAVEVWLVKKGIEGTRLFSKGYGQTAPLTKDSSPASIKLNTRFTFKII